MAPSAVSSVSPSEIKSKGVKRVMKAAKPVESTDKVPNFLRKTYHIVDTCDPSIASWSEDGLSFVIKDTERLASGVLGQFFKHNNFSSFVRQLNFYGFRKIKANPLITINGIQENTDSHHWKFKHEKFQRGKQYLLSEIRKPNPTEMADKHEVEVLKSELNDLRGTIKSMHCQINKLTMMVNHLMKNQSPSTTPAIVSPDAGATGSSSSPATKRRKVIPGLTIAAAAAANAPVVPFPVESIYFSTSASEEASTSYEESTKVLPFMMSSSSSASSSSSMDGDLHNTIGSDVHTDNILSHDASVEEDEQYVLSSEEEYLLSELYPSDTFVDIDGING